MSIKIGDKIPNVSVSVMTSEGARDITTDEIFSGKKVVLFALPGAFTPTCSARHLPGYVTQHDAFNAKGVDTIVCLSVNDAFVMGAWGESLNVGNKVLMVADGSRSFTQAVDLELDLTARNFGVRSQRYALVAEDGVVTILNIEAPSEFDVSDAETILSLL